MRRLRATLLAGVLAAACSRSNETSVGASPPVTSSATSPRSPSVDAAASACRPDEELHADCGSAIEPITKRAPAPYADCPATGDEMGMLAASLRAHDPRNASYLFDAQGTAERRKKFPPPRAAKWALCCYSRCEQIVRAVAADAAVGKEECIARPAPDRWLPAQGDPRCPERVLFEGLGQTFHVRTVGDQCCYHSPIRPPPTIH